MKKLEGYRDVTDVFIKKPCEYPGCNRDSELPTRFNEETREFERWMCVKHAMKYLKDDDDDS